MEFSTSDPIFRHFGLSALLILAKMLSMSLITSSKRIKHGKFANKEDAHFSKPTGPVDIKVKYLMEEIVNSIQLQKSKKPFRQHLEVKTKSSECVAHI